MTSQTVLNGCAGTLAVTTCTETSIPEGTWVYTITPVVDIWAGAESAQSTPVVTDTTPPTNSITLFPVNGSSYQVGSTIYYRGVAAGSFKLINAVTDGGSGPGSSTTSALGGTSTGWHAPTSTISTPTRGPYTSEAFTWTAGTTTSPTEVVTGADANGNTATTTLTFVNDSSGPSGGSVTISGLGGTGNAYSTSTTVHISLAKGSDPNGLATSGATLLRASATLTSTAGADGVCGNFGSYATIATDPGATYDDSVADNTCYKYEYAVFDTVGNPTIYLSNVIKVDSTAPAAPAGAFGSFTNTYAAVGSSTFYYNSNSASGSITATPSDTDSTSGIASYNFPTLGTNWSKTQNADGSVTYSWSGAPAAPGTKYVTATNNAGLTSAGTAFYPTADATAPTSGSISYPNTVQLTTSVVVTLTTGTDSGSGLGAKYLQRSSASYVSGLCGTFGSFTSIATNPTTPYTDTVTKGYCYKYRYVVNDNVGNSTTATSANVVKVSTNAYNTAITGTAGLIDYWRLDEATGTTMTDTKATNGTYVNAPTLGVAGAFDDGDTATAFDGVSDYATVTKTLSGNFSVEFAFKSTQGIGSTSTTQWWGGAGLVDADVSSSTSKDWGISLRADGKIMAGDGNSTTPGDQTAISSGSYNDGSWHLVDVTRNQSTGVITIYVDGVSVGSVTGTTVALTSPTVTFGRISSGGNFFAGTLDDVSFYNTVLSASTITSHYTATGF
jgi:hypothetical protein